MTYDISFLTGINDQELKLDQEGLEYLGTVKIIHLVKTGPCKCPVCGRPMLKNGYRHQPVKVKGLFIANVPTFLFIKKQKYICSHHLVAHTR